MAHNNCSVSIYYYYCCCCCYQITCGNSIDQDSGHQLLDLEQMTSSSCPFPHNSERVSLHLTKLSLLHCQKYPLHLPGKQAWQVPAPHFNKWEEGTRAGGAGRRCSSPGPVLGSLHPLCHLWARGGAGQTLSGPRALPSPSSARPSLHSHAACASVAAALDRPAWQRSILESKPLITKKAK